MHFAFTYYFESGTSLISDPAYVGALQRDLRRLGYYCGPIDGVFSPGVSGRDRPHAKELLYAVTGTLTVRGAAEPCICLRIQNESSSQ